MKRIILGVSIVVVVAVALAGATYFIVENAIKQARQPAHGGANVPAPFSYAQLEKMIDAKDAPADSEIPKLIACFDKSEEVPQFGKVPMGIAASEALARIGPAAVEPLRASLKDLKNVKMRYYAAQTLGRMGPSAAPAASDLLVCLHDSDAEVRFKSAFALGQLGLQTDSVIEGLAVALGDSDADVSRTAAEALEKIGPPALPRMYALVGPATGAARERLVDTLERIGSPPLNQLPLLAGLAKDPSEVVRHDAIKLLCKLEEPAVPVLKELLMDPKLLNSKPNVDFDVIVRAMVPLGKKAEPLLPELQAVMIANHYWNAEEQLMETIKKCGPAGADTLTKVLKALHDPKASPDADGAARPRIVVQRLGEMGADAKDAVPALVVILKERGPLQPHILDALGDIGPAARAKAAPAVEILAKQAQNPELAEKARTALNRMGVFQKQTETPKKDKLPK